jgi:hypothetical protein
MRRYSRARTALLISGMLIFSGAAQAQQEKGSSFFSWERDELNCLVDSAGLSGRTPVPSVACEQTFFDPILVNLEGAWCQDPKRFCEHVRDAKKQDPSGKLLRESLSAGGCRIPVMERLERMEDAQQEKEILQVLEARSEGDGVFHSLYSGESWERVLKMVGHVQALYLEEMNRTPPRVSDSVKERISKLRVINPFDPNTSESDRETILSSCMIGDSWKTQTAQEQKTLGNWYAFAQADGAVVICPKVLLAMNDEGMAQLLIHEISHLVGPCALGVSLWGQLEAPNCTLPQDDATEGLLTWIGRLRRLEKCTHEAGINSGSLAKTISRIARSEQRSKKSMGPGCSHVLPHFLAPSSDREKGILSYCDMTLYLGAYGMSATLERGELQNQRESGGEPFRTRVLSRIKELKLYLKEKKLGRLSERPDSNQFNETYSDLMASRYLPALLTRLGVTPQSKDVLDGFSWICREPEDRKLKHESHGLAPQRFQVLSSQPALREWMGCSQKKAPTSLGRDLAGCLKEVGVP